MQRTPMLLSAACLWIAVAAQAQTPTPTQPIYAQMGYSFLTQSLKASGIAIKSDVEQVTATIGYQVHPRVAVEGQLGLGIGNKQASVLTGSSAYSNKINNSFAVFIKPQVDFTEQFSVHARIGYSQAVHEITDTKSKVSYTTSGLAYGVGAQYAVTPNLNVFVDYYVMGGNISGYTGAVGNADFSGYTIGAGYKY